jgi:hypothetical protein
VVEAVGDGDSKVVGSGFNARTGGCGHKVQSMTQGENRENQDPDTQDGSQAVELERTAC